MPHYPTDSELSDLDQAFAADGVPVTARPDKAMWNWLKNQPDGICDFTSEARWFTQKFAEMHPSVDFSPKPFVFLAASARGIAYCLHPPVVYGSRSIDPIRSVKISKPELERIWTAEPGAFWELYFQAADGIDLFLSDLDFHPTNPDAAKMLAVGTNQLEASARQLVAGASDASLSQACCLSCEMVLKAVLREQGVTEARLRALSHRIENLAAEVAKVMPNANDPELLAIASSMPSYVSVRYDPPELSVQEAHDLYRRALFVCAEALRRTRHDQLYYKIMDDPSVPPRVWQRRTPRSI